MATNIEKDLKLIELYRNKPILWDSRLEEYKLSEKKPAAWLQIADECSMSAGEAKRRITTMRSSYRRARKQMLDYLNKPSGSAGGKGTKPRVYKYAAELVFLNDVVNVNETEDNVPASQCSSAGDSGAEKESIKVKLQFYMVFLNRTDVTILNADCSCCGETAWPYYRAARFTLLYVIQYRKESDM
jgi:hypothetical protein